MAQWPTTRIGSLEELLALLMERHGNGWLFRGQSKNYPSQLSPSIDRAPLDSLTRLEKLTLERESIETFRSAARYFSSVGERRALTDDIVALMVLRHYGVPTRLLDWSASPFVAAFFAIAAHLGSDGEVWSFNEPLYERQGAKQWEEHPETTTCGTGDPSRFAAGLTAFRVNLAFDWFICAFYGEGFPRQNAQSGAYTMTAQFSQNHADHITRLLVAPEHYHRYEVPAEIKQEATDTLRRKYGITRGRLFPDSAGAAELAKGRFQPRQ